EHHVLAQVSLSALLEPALKRGTRRYFWMRGRYAQQLVDFVILNLDLDVLVLVEMGDCQQSRKRDEERDAVSAAAGYTTIRFSSALNPSIYEIRAAVSRAVLEKTPGIISGN